MRFQLEAEPHELEAKGPELIKTLLERLEPFCPHLHDEFEKASVPRKESELKFPALQGMKQRAGVEYRKLMTQMIDEIASVIDGGDHQDHTQRIAEKDGLKYSQIIAKLAEEHGFTMEDFAQGGRFYGKSVNELIEFARAFNQKAGINDDADQDLLIPSEGE